MDVERAAIGWRIAKAGDEQDAANFAYDHMDEILGEIVLLQSFLERLLDTALPASTLRVPPYLVEAIKEALRRE